MQGNKKYNICFQKRSGIEEKQKIHIHKYNLKGILYIISWVNWAWLLSITGYSKSWICDFFILKFIANVYDFYVFVVCHTCHCVCLWFEDSHSSSLGSSCVTLMERRSTRSCRELTRKEKVWASLNSSPNRSSAYLPAHTKRYTIYFCNFLYIK